MEQSPSWEAVSGLDVEEILVFYANLRFINVVRRSRQPDESIP
jgi:hypothetical protein